MSPDVSVISVFYNRAEYVRDSVASLVSQSLDSCEIILVDDGSSDDTEYQLQTFARQDSRVIVRSGPNQGFTRALRSAISDAQGKYIAIHGSGDISYPDRLKKQSTLLNDIPNIGVVGCKVITETAVPGETTLYFRNVGVNASKTLSRHNLFTHGEVMFRRNIYDNVGGYRDFFTYSQDYDLWCRMSRVTDFFVIPETLYERRLIPGVSTSVTKRTAQALYSQFARFCHHEVLKGRPDPLETLGPVSLAIMPRTRATSNRLAKRSIRCALRGHTKDAKFLLSVAKSQRATLLTLLAEAMTSRWITGIIPQRTLSRYLVYRDRRSRSKTNPRVPCGDRIPRS